MVLVDHPHVLKSHCSFVIDHTLRVVMPYMGGGSCLHMLKAVHPNGFEEVVIATILRDVLKGLGYLHQHGHIHRDVKDCIINLMWQVAVADYTDAGCMLTNTTVTDKSSFLQLEAAHDREKELLRQISELQWRLICAQEDLQKYKTENAQVNFMG